MLGEREQVDQVVRASTLLYNNIQQTLTLGLMVLAKHDRTESRHEEGYTNQQLAEADAFTASEVDRFREQAGLMLGQYVANLAVPTAIEPRRAQGWAAARE